MSTAEIARCKQDKDYEPAGVLLERIKKEKNKKKVAIIIEWKRINTIRTGKEVP